jgi:hypothetical protein
MKKAFIIIFIAICMIPVITMLFFPHIDINYENRTLTVFPTKISTDITTELQDYFSDNFGMRSTFISLNSLLYYDILNESPNAKVIAGKDGWLFFKDTVNDYTGAAPLSDAQMHRLYRMIRQMSSYLESVGIRLYFTIAPNKNSIYGEYMPDRYRLRRNDSNMVRLAKLFTEDDPPYIDLYKVLIAGKDSGQLYYKKDTHWNSRGAYIAFSEIAARLGKDVKMFSELTYQTQKDYFGDLQKMLTPAFRIYDDRIYLDLPEDYLYKKHMNSFDDMIIETNAPEAATDIVMFRDSFANALIPIMSGSFRDAAYLRQFPYDMTAAAAYEPDCVIIEIAERNLPNLLEKAPVFISKPLPGDYFTVLETKTIETELKAVRYNDTVKISGSISSPDIYEIYIRVRTPGHDNIFEAVSPDPEKDSTTDFSLIMDKSDLSDGSLKIEVICFDGTNTFICHAEDDMRIS